MGWSDLPPEVARTIAGKLTEIADHVRFRRVCPRWRSAVKSILARPQLPWLLLPANSSSSDRHNFYSFSQDRLFHFPYPDSQISYLHGSAKGWVLAFEGKKRAFTLSLINPFSGEKFSLPTPDSYCSLYYADPDSIVWDCSREVIIASCRRSKDVYYYHLDGPDEHWYMLEAVQDAVSIAFITCSFYIVDSSSILTILEDDSLKVQYESRDSIIPPTPNPPLKFNFFVSSNYDCLLLVKFACKKRKQDGNQNESYFYRIYSAERGKKDEEYDDWDSSEEEKKEEMDEEDEKFSDEEEILRWHNEIFDIGNRAIFVDGTHCMSLEVPKGSELNRNCVYSSQSRIVGDKRVYSIYASQVGDTLGERLLSEVSTVNVGKGKSCSPTWVLPMN